MPVRLAITVGEPAGIGPDLCIQLAQTSSTADLVFITDPQLIIQRSRQLNTPITIRPFDASISRALPLPGTLGVLPVTFPHIPSAGQPHPDNAAPLLQALDIAVEGCRTGLFDAMVTGPLDKGVINEAGIVFSGHTEYLAEQTATPQVVMMLATETLRVALVTTHIPLSAVPAAITKEHLTRVIRILCEDLGAKFGIESPTILVCGLNPHAGEGGYIGHEEIDVITPVLDKLRGEGMNLIGPVPADTAFTPARLSRCDAVLAMYHDQGLPVLKHVGFDDAVNITLGLPLIRTSVDHGTAYDLAGTGRASTGSLNAAIHLATALAAAQH